MKVVSVRKKMLKTKVCWALAFALINSLWVQALPSLTFLDKNAFYNRGRFRALECPENEFLNDEGKACEPTCENPIRPDVCEEKKVITCECDDGYVRNATGACIRPEKCLHQLPPKSENTLSASGSEYNGVIIEVVEPWKIESDDNEAIMLESRTDDLEDLENTDTIQGESEFDPGLLEYLSNAHNEYHRQHIIEHQHELSDEEKHKAAIDEQLRKIFSNNFKFDDTKYSIDDKLVHIDNYVPTIFK